MCCCKDRFPVPHLSPRTSLFCQVELCVLKRLQLSYLRIDGSTDVNARNTAVQKFQETKDYSGEPADGWVGCQMPGGAPAAFFIRG